MVVSFLLNKIRMLQAELKNEIHANRLRKFVIMHEELNYPVGRMILAEICFK